MATLLALIGEAKLKSVEQVKQEKEAKKAKGRQDKKRKRDGDKKRAGEVKAVAPADTNTDASVSRPAAGVGKTGAKTENRQKKAKLNMQDAKSFVDHMKQRFGRSPGQYDRFILILQVRHAPPMQWRVGNLTHPMRANARVRPGISSAAAHLGEHEQEHGRATARPP